MHDSHTFVLICAKQTLNENTTLIILYVAMIEWKHSLYKNLSYFHREIRQ